MKITTKWFGDQFNVGLANGDRPEFLSIKGCRIKSGEKGEFISWPAQKKDDGTYWRHAWGSDEFQAAVIREAKKSQPQDTKPARQKDEAWQARAPARQAAPEDEDIPF
jgi:DNA-binding cell septation regulator SpoVG